MIVYLKADGSVKKIYPDTLTQGSSTGSIVLIAEGVSNYSTISVTAKLPVSGQIVEVGIMTPISAYTLDNEVVYAYYVNLTDSLTNFAGNLQLTFSVTNSGKTNSYIVTWAINPTLEPTLPTAPDTDWYDNIKEAFAYLTGKINTDIPQDIADAITNHNNSQDAHPYLLGLISALTNSVPQQIETHNTSSTAHQDIRSDIQTNTDDISAILNNSKIIKNANGGFVAGDVDNTANKDDDVRIGNNLQGLSGVQIGSSILSRVGIGKNVTDRGGSYDGIGVGAGVQLKGGVGVGTNINGEYNGVYLGNDLHDYSNSYQPSIMIGSKIKTDVNGAKETITINNGSKQVENKEDGSFQVNQYNILTKDGKLRTNIGTADNPQMVEVLTQGEAGVYKYKGSVQTYADLPTENNQAGDVWNVIEKYESYPAGTNFAWTPDGTWDALGGTIEVDVGEPIAEAIRDNTTQIVGYRANDTFGSFRASGAKPALSTYSRSGGIAVGLNAEAMEHSIALGDGAIAKNNASEYDTIAIGYKAKVDGQTSGIAIGTRAEAFNSSIAIGTEAKVSGPDISTGYDVYKSIQLGKGTNSTSNSLQIFDDNIYKADTHTLTVQNIEQNGNPVYGILSGTVDPTSETVGAVSQFYLNTTDKKLWQCVAVTTDESTSTTSYEWQSVGGGMAILTGTDKPTETTVGEVGQMYLRKDTSTGLRYIWICTGTRQSKYMWENIGGGNSINGTFVAGGAHPSNMGGTIAIGKNSSSITGGIIIGGNGQVGNGIVLGNNATCNSDYAMVINPDSSFSKATATKAIQIGAGTNSIANTLQIRDDNIYNMDTHTLTVQNIELNGVDLGTLLGDINTALETILGV